RSFVSAPPPPRRRPGPRRRPAPPPPPVGPDAPRPGGHDAGFPSATPAPSPPSASRHDPHPRLQGRDPPGPRPAPRLGVRGHGLSVVVGGGQSHHRLPLQRLSLLSLDPKRGLITPTNAGAQALPKFRCGLFQRLSPQEGR